MSPINYPSLDARHVTASAYQASHSSSTSHSSSIRRAANLAKAANLPRLHKSD